MSIMTKELVKLGNSHFWLEIEHLGQAVAAKFSALTPIADIHAEVSALHADAQAKLEAVQKLPEYLAYVAAKSAFDQANAVANPAP